MRANGIKKIAFSSTGSVYGEAKVIPTPEDAPFPIQTSLYGASKAAGEGLIAAYCEGFGFEACIFRFVSILGERYTHGHVFDFYKQLKTDPKELRVLGNGRQRKSYLYVQDCIEAIMLAMARAPEQVKIYNLGVDGYCEVNNSIGWICEALGLSPRLVYSGGDRGWIGDNPFIFLDTAGSGRSAGRRSSRSVKASSRRSSSSRPMSGSSGRAHDREIRRHNGGQPGLGRHLARRSGRRGSAWGSSVATARRCGKPPRNLPPLPARCARSSRATSASRMRRAP